MFVSPGTRSHRFENPRGTGLVTATAGTSTTLSGGTLRQALTANTTYYVTTTGSDSNTGLVNSAAGSFLTIQKAVNVVYGTLDLNGFNVTIQVGAGTYTGAVSITSAQVGSGTITISGDFTTPANVTISVTSTNAIAVAGPGVKLSVSGLKLVTNTSGNALQVSQCAVVTIAGNMEFGACGTGGVQMLAQDGGVISLFFVNYIISGSAAAHLYALTNGTIDTTFSTVTINNALTFSSAFVLAGTGGQISASSNTYSVVGSVTGTRFIVNTCAAVGTGGSASYFPGTVAGTVATGGQEDAALANYGSNTIASGSLPAAATLTISSIPNIYAYLVLHIAGWGQGTATSRLLVRIGNGSGDSTAGNYVGHDISGTTVTNFTTNASASCTDGTTQTTAQTGTATVVIHGYASGPHKRFDSRILANTTETQSIGTYIGTTSAIDTIVVSNSTANNFNAGTYALYGYM